MRKYYVDTSIWRDYHENRTDRFRPLGEWALAFFDMVKNECGIVLYSDVTVNELRKDYDDEDIKEIFSIFDNNGLLKVSIKPEQVAEAHRLSKERNVPGGDALNAILARDSGAIVVARDHHFEELIDISDCKKPEELI